MRSGERILSVKQSARRCKRCICYFDPLKEKHQWESRITDVLAWWMIYNKLCLSNRPKRIQLSRLWLVQIRLHSLLVSRFLTVSWLDEKRQHRYDFQGILPQFWYYSAGVPRWSVFRWLMMIWLLTFTMLMTSYLFLKWSEILENNQDYLQLAWIMFWAQNKLL